MTAFVPVHNHSEYSALDGLSTPREIAERCQCIGCNAAGITDHGTVAGHLAFGKAMREHDIKPIFGVEFYHGVKTEFGKNERDQFHFVAGALSDEGLRNVWRMVDAASDPTRYRYVGRVGFDICERFSEGVFATSACIQGLVAQAFLTEHNGQQPTYLHGVLDRYLEIYRENFYIEIHTYPGDEHRLLNTYLVNVAHERGIPLIYATDAHFASPEAYPIHDAYVAMQTGDSIWLDPADRKMWHPKSLYIQDEAQIRASLSYLPDRVVDEALRNSAELAGRCNADLPEVRRHIPVFVPAECPWHERDESPAMMFIDLVEAGIHRRYGGADAEIAERAWEQSYHEIEVMLDAGLEHYFLQVWDVCEYCNRNGITRGPGRGSAAGSIVSYALGITDIDPLRYDLIFERFWNAGRAKGFPDIDIDFPVTQRKKVRQYLMDRWGHDKVRTIGTTTRLKPKTVLDKTAKACGVTWDEKEALKAIVSDVPDIDIHGADTIGWSQESDPGKTIYVMHHVGRRILEWLAAQAEERLDVLIRWLEIVDVICSRVSGYGVHPSGVVVSDVALSDELPCMYNRAQEVQVTCFPMSDVDARQFLKDDFLGLRNLDTLEDWEKQMGEHPDWHALTYEEHPEAMWQLLDEGLTLGIFQIEKGYARHLCKEMMPRSIDDLGVIVAVNRPGPIRAKVPESYIRRRRGEEEVTYDHPILEPITKDTYGHLVYQEQIMRFFEAIGYDKGDTDEIRKILGKKKPEVMRTVQFGEAEWRGKGYMMMANQAGIIEHTAAAIWAKVEGFASYSFNKSHAIAYATMAFRTLYAKWRDGHRFEISCIRTNAEDAGDYVSEGRRREIEVRPPHIAQSAWDIARNGDHIYFGFSNVKGIGVGTAKYLVNLRDRHEIFSADSLREAVQLEQQLWEAERNEARGYGFSGKLARSPQQQCRANVIDVLEKVGAFDEYTPRELPLSKLQTYEKELLQVILTDDCEDVLANNADEIAQCDAYHDLAASGPGTRWHLPGVISTISPKQTRNGNKAMGIITMEYQGDETEFVVFPREWKKYRSLWKERTPAIITLMKTDRGIHLDAAAKLS